VALDRRIVYAIGAIQWSNGRQIKIFRAVCGKLIYVLHCTTSATKKVQDCRL